MPNCSFTKMSSAPIALSEDQLADTYLIHTQLFFSQLSQQFITPHKFLLYLKLGLMFLELKLHAAFFELLKVQRQRLKLFTFGDKFSYQN